ncbi:MAG TPA: endonuclease/exonuclease/phosphatase family protein [Acidisoma sp.]|uniref:endonuclease/exonuclease/phosphatase family protein n=1 Tax=Acidisoma sp. TaxID=1872115 RepID=UPI002C1CCFC7|nr:endonuclease/exonuclease/phosphatase family protein [Acidisoma sp.]HTI02256.1 endonuclease/exonuclease/phosphatase family protein [Acidisoma sp.]
MKLISWNLLHREGAALSEVAKLIEQERPDALLMQEVTPVFENLPQFVGGSYSRTPLPGRRHGLAIWTPAPPPRPPAIFALPAGAVVKRICQIVDLGPFSAANVHLSHSQLLNRRQLRHVALHLPAHAAVLGDYNLVGPVLLPGFRDAGPRQPTHRMSDFLPLRLDRCLIRGLACLETRVLERAGSDHHPILVRLEPAPAVERRTLHPIIARYADLARENARRLRRP